MESGNHVSITELRLSYHYIREQPWAMTAVNGLLADSFMEQPIFHVCQDATVFLWA
jgi:hypothetical protein